MLNRAYEVLRDPTLKEAYDVFGVKGIGTSAASDRDNSARRRSSNSVQRPTSNPPRSSSSSSSSGSGFYAGNADFATGWPSGTSSSSSSSSSRTRQNGNSVRPDNAQVRNPTPGGPYGSRSASSQSRNRVVDPNPVGGATTKSSSSNGTSGRRTADRGNVRVDPSVFSSDPGFRPQTRASSSSAYTRTRTGVGSSATGSRRAYTAGPKEDDESAFFGNMGTIHTQPATDMGRNNFVPRDGASFTSGEAFFGRGPKFGRDVLVDMELDVKMAKSGGTKVIQVQHMETCDTCSGVGTKDATSQVLTCRHCGGSGHVMNSSQMRETCPICLGTGCKIANPCGSCHGLGVQETTISVQVNIPKQVDDGYTMRLPGLGDAGPNGGPSGDLYVCFQIPDDKKTKPQEAKKKAPQKDAVSTTHKAALDSAPHKLTNEIAATAAAKSIQNIFEQPLSSSSPATTVQDSAPHTPANEIVATTAARNIKNTVEQPSSSSSSATTVQDSAPHKPANEIAATVAGAQENEVSGKRRRRIRNFFGGVVSSIWSK